jgi:hypothetical protein
VAFLEGDSQAASLGTWASGSLLAMALAGVPAIILGLRGVFGRPPDPLLRPAAGWIPASVGLAFPIALLAGAWTLARPDLTLIDHPGPHRYGGLPVALAVLLVQTTGTAITLRRLWSQFLAGLWGMPLVAILLEVATLVPVVAITVIGLSSSADIRRMTEPLLQGTPVPGVSLDETVLRLFLHPWVLVNLFGYVSGLVPLIEEAVKTLSVLPIAGRLTPSQAFLGGAVGGAGYALFEALFLTQPDPSWLTTMIGRGGASLMHAFTAAITCWGISQVTAGRRRWGRLALAYLVSVGMHATWNAAAIGLGIVQVNMEIGSLELPGGWETLVVRGAPILLSALQPDALVGLPLGALRLRQWRSPEPIDGGRFAPRVEWRVADLNLRAQGVCMGFDLVNSSRRSVTSA